MLLMRHSLAKQKVQVQSTCSTDSLLPYLRALVSKTSVRMGPARVLALWIFEKLLIRVLLFAFNLPSWLKLLESNDSTNVSLQHTEYISWSSHICYDIFFNSSRALWKLYTCLQKLTHLTLMETGPILLGEDWIGLYLQVALII